jgi:hypothetical protein
MTATELGPGPRRISRQRSCHFSSTPPTQKTTTQLVWANGRLQLEVDLSKLTFDDVREQLHLDHVAAPLVEGCVE